LENLVSAPPHGGEVFAAARRLGVPVSRVLDFSASINPLGPSPKALRRLRRDLRLIRFYPEAENRELRDLVAEQEGVDPRCILFGNGATQLLHLVPRVLKPRKAVIVEPGFAEYRAALERAGCRVQSLPLSEKAAFRLERTPLLKTIRREHPALLVLGHPNNPTGTAIPDSLLSELIHLCAKNHVQLVVDESFIEFTSRRSRARDASRRPHLIVARSLTKFWALAGLRIGYLVGQQPLVERLSSHIEPWSVNSLASAAAADSLRDANYRRDTLALLRRERAFLRDRLFGLGWLRPFPSEANFLLVRIETPELGSTELRQKLERCNILVRDGVGFPGLGSRYIRVAIRNRRDNERLIDALASVRRSAQALSRGTP
jgi:threonine-phosphate decarboxylase